MRESTFLNTHWIEVIRYYTNFSVLFSYLQMHLKETLVTCGSREIEEEQENVYLRIELHRNCNPNH